MLLSLAMIFIIGSLAGWCFSKLRLPPLTGMLAAGIALGPCCLGLIDSSVLTISPQLRQIALVIILLRAGLNLKLGDLKKVGRPAILMCFVPASFEIIGTFIAAPLLFGFSRADALVLGTVIAAVSPAVVVPHMLKLMDEGYGVEQGIPQMILAGASADDVFVIVLFTSFTEMAQSGRFNALGLLRIPTSIVLGAAAGALVGFVLRKLTQKTSADPSRAALFLLSASFLLVALESAATGAVGFSGLIAVMTSGLTFALGSEKSAAAVSNDLSRLWIGAEILLFVLVGAAVDVSCAFDAGIRALLLIPAALLFRMTGVLVCVAGTKLNRNERIFSMLAYTPKATVQAAIGAIPLSLGFASGNTILTVAVVAILVTAPLGAFMIDLTYKRLLRKKSAPPEREQAPAGKSKISG